MRQARACEDKRCGAGRRKGRTQERFLGVELEAARRGRGALSAWAALRRGLGGTASALGAPLGASRAPRSRTQRARCTAAAARATAACPTAPAAGGWQRSRGRMGGGALYTASARPHAPQLAQLLAQVLFGVAQAVQVAVCVAGGLVRRLASARIGAGGSLAEASRSAHASAAAAAAAGRKLLMPQATRRRNAAEGRTGAAVASAALQPACSASLFRPRLFASVSAYALGAA